MDSRLIFNTFDAEGPIEDSPRDEDNDVWYSTQPLPTMEHDQLEINHSLASSSMFQDPSLSVNRCLAASLQYASSLHTYGLDQYTGPIDIPLPDPGFSFIPTGPLVYPAAFGDLIDPFMSINAANPAAARGSDIFAPTLEALSTNAFELPSAKTPKAHGTGITLGPWDSTMAFKTSNTDQANTVMVGYMGYPMPDFPLAVTEPAASLILFEGQSSFESNIDVLMPDAGPSVTVPTRQIVSPLAESNFPFSSIDDNALPPSGGDQFTIGLTTSIPTNAGGRAVSLRPAFKPLRPKMAMKRLQPANRSHSDYSAQNLPVERHRPRSPSDRKQRPQFRR